MASDVEYLRREVNRLRNITIEGYNRRESPGGVMFHRSLQHGPLHLLVQPLYVDSDNFFDVIRCSQAKDTPGSIYVAKPYLLRRTPFHNQRRDGIEFNYTSNTERIATRREPPPSEGQQPPTENQRIIPKYVKNDVIYVLNKAQDGVERLFQSEDLRVHAVWIDVNFDGRYWAKV